MIAELLRELYIEIQHGDEEHKAWLRDKIEQFIKERGLE